MSGPGFSNPCDVPETQSRDDRPCGLHDHHQPRRSPKERLGLADGKMLDVVRGNGDIVMVDAEQKGTEHRDEEERITLPREPIRI